MGLKRADHRRWTIALAAACALATGGRSAEAQPTRARAVGVAPGIFKPGAANAITDVAGVRVGQVTLHREPDVHTGVTVVVPHGGNLFQDKVPAGLVVENGFGKLTGSTQIVELGEIETPIALTNTLSTPQAADALITWTLGQPGNEAVRSVNPVVGETNDGFLNNIRKRSVRPEDVLDALRAAKAGPVEEGSVGAGAGTMAFDWKGGIGTSSRVLPASLGGYAVGVLVQSNFGGALNVDGDPVGVRTGKFYLSDKVAEQATPSTADGSLMIVIATDAPLSDRNLTRLARRAFAGQARTGSAFSNGSGDYAIAFSTSEKVRRTPARRRQAAEIADLPNDAMSPLFVAVAEATEEAIYNSLLQARTIRSQDAQGRPVVGEALDRKLLAPRRPAR